MRKVFKNRTFIQWVMPAILYGTLFILLWFVYMRSSTPMWQTKLRKKTPHVQENTPHTKINDIKQLYLFGEPLIKTEAQNTLKGYKLVGIIYRKNGERSAIISINDKERVYKAGAKLGNTITLKKIEANRIILRTSKGQEALELFIEE